MLDWLKTILGDAYTAEIDAAVSKQIGLDDILKLYRKNSANDSPYRKASSDAYKKTPHKTNSPLDR